MFEVRDSDGQQVEVIRVEATDTIEPYLAALDEAGWTLISGAIDHGSVVRE